MNPSNVDTIARIPWGDQPSALPLSITDFPLHSEAASPDVNKSAEAPLFRAYDGGRVAALNFYGHRYLPAGTLRWFHKPADAAEMSASEAAYPFPDAANLVAVDFHVTDDGALVLLETVAGGDGGRTSRIASITAAGTLALSKASLGDAPYDRIVPVDDGRLLLLDSRDNNRLDQLDLATGAASRRYSARPGTRLALAANKGTRLASRLLEHPPDGAIATPSDLPSATIYLFGVDGDGNYYVFMEPDIRVISFDGRLLQTVSLADTLEHMRSSQASIAPRLSPLVAWQVDQAGRIYLSSVDADGFSILRVAAPAITTR